jgi:hypothetical protein
MATTTEYCTDEAVIARLSQGGLLACADDDADGVASAAELAAALTESKRWTKGQIDSAMKAAGFTLPITQDTASLDPLLEGIAIDMNVFRMSTRRGHPPGPSIETAFADARKDLSDLAARKRRAPTLTYPGDGLIEHRAAYGRPAVACLGRKG